MCYYELLPKYLHEPRRQFHCPQVWPVYGSALLSLHWEYTAQARPVHQDAVLKTSIAPTTMAVAVGIPLHHSDLRGQCHP